MKKLLVFTFVVIFVVCQNSAQNFEGVWYGSLWESVDLEVEFVKEGDDYKAVYNLFGNSEQIKNKMFESVILMQDSLICQFSYFEHDAIYNAKFNDSLGEFKGGLNFPVWNFAEPLKLTRVKTDFADKKDNIYSQRRKQSEFTQKDTIRGALTKERSWWDLNHYELNISINPKDSSISGYNEISYKVLSRNSIMQIDLQSPLKIDEVTQNGRKLEFDRDGNAYFIHLKKEQLLGELNKIKVEYSGKPYIAENPPWKGGFTWAKDRLENPFISTSCQFEGASIWYPCKDHPFDEVDSMQIALNVPGNLIGVSNGKLLRVEEHDNETKTYYWNVVNPINNYGVSINVADYAHFSNNYKGLNGNLTCDYYVLKQNLSKAKEHFKQAHLMLEAFEHWFGPYPFYKDGYKLVESPHLGMEHQSAVAYGANFKNGFMGVDLSGSGWGFKFDYIIIHESGHEWFGNNITHKDVADMWIHEGFTTYSESLFLEYYYGKNAAEEYLKGLRKLIYLDIPIIGKYDVWNFGSDDMFLKVLIFYTP